MSVGGIHTSLFSMKLCFQFQVHKNHQNSMISQTLRFRRDRKEWMSWIENTVVRRLTPEEVLKVDKRLIFKAPARIVRVNKGALEGILRAKSRMVIPGHLDPHLGEYRSDAPTTAWVAVQMAKCIASNRGWEASSFDVSTAFLSGKEVQREVYIRAPMDGLPACPQLGEKAVAPGELLRVCKSAYGLSEARGENGHVSQSKSHSPITRHLQSTCCVGRIYTKTIVRKDTQKIRCSQQ